MKRNLIYVLLSTIFSFVNAQNIQQTEKSNQNSNLSFGVKGGYSLSTMKYDKTSLDSKSYFYAGIVGEKIISTKVSLQAEILYTQVGGKETFHDYLIGYDPLLNSNEIKNDYKFTQLQIPISAKYYFIPNISASIGMNFGINISKKVKADIYGNGTMTTEYENAKTLNLFPFLGAEYKLTDNFFLDARYNFNFFDINKQYASTKIGFLQAGVGYRFN